MKSVGEDRLFVSAAVVVGVFEDEKFVVGLGVARFVVRVAGHGGDPEAAFVVEGKLDWIGEVGKLFVGSEESDPVALGDFNFLRGAFGGKVSLFGFSKIGKRRGLGVGFCDINEPGGGGGPNRLVTNMHHLGELGEFGGIVFRTVRTMAPAKDVHAVRDLVVVSPQPAFF